MHASPSLGQFLLIHRNGIWFIQQTTYPIQSDQKVNNKMAGRRGGAILPEICLFVPLLKRLGVVLGHEILHRHFCSLFLSSCLKDNLGHQQESKWDFVYQISSYYWWCSRCCLGVINNQPTGLYLELCCCSRWLSSTDPDTFKDSG